jgi:hypothetical protein
LEQSEDVSFKKNFDGICNVCSKQFLNLPELMKHKKREHIEVVNMCSKKGECKFPQCWYKHEEKDRNQDFQKIPKEDKPPERILLQDWMKKIETKMEELKSKLN